MKGIKVSFLLAGLSIMPCLISGCSSAWENYESEAASESAKQDELAMAQAKYSDDVDIYLSPTDCYVEGKGSGRTALYRISNFKKSDPSVVSEIKMRAQASSGNFREATEIIDQALTAYQAHREIQGIDRAAIKQYFDMPEDVLNTVMEKAKQECPYDYWGQNLYIRNEIDSYANIQLQ